MARPLVELSKLDLSQDVVSEEELRSLVPHREQFQLLDGICHFDAEQGLVVGYKDWGDDPWWGRGHIPGRPLMPGVLMVEALAQVLQGPPDLGPIVVAHVVGIGEGSP